MKYYFFKVEHHYNSTKEVVFQIEILRSIKKLKVLRLVDLSQNGMFDRGLRYGYTARFPAYAKGGRVGNDGRTPTNAARAGADAAGHAAEGGRPQGPRGAAARQRRVPGDEQAAARGVGQEAAGRAAAELHVGVAAARRRL